ncbi:hypothetical protein DCCM_2848 [Desulfocucumis palustris]|uniref:Uncharacterized protein n=1 Tax=Desulfocucumis palustris TaxID=1898651 RepID=A0A2L2XBY3_9FIRM|nr:hypothetical protein DCCM_2848 [Desulfocucumis palustris]
MVFTPFYNKLKIKKPEDILNISQAFILPYTQMNCAFYLGPDQFFQKLRNPIKPLNMNFSLNTIPCVINFFNLYFDWSLLVTAAWAAASKIDLYSYFYIVEHFILEGGP